MQTFATTPGTTLVVTVPSAHVILTAARTATISVDVAPAHEWLAADRRAAAQVIVVADDESVTVSAPQRWFPTMGTARITVTVPEGTDVRTDTGNGALRAVGELGHAEVRTSNGALHVSAAASLHAETSNGALRVGNVRGEAELRTSSGSIHAERLGTLSRLRSSNGALRIGEAGAQLTATTSNGSVKLGSTSGTTSLRSANGAVQVASVEGGVLEAITTNGKVTVGVPEGVSAWVDARTRAGKVVNELTPGAAPASDRTAELHLSTSAGSILLRRPDPSRA